MSRTRSQSRAAAPWHPAWRSSPLVYTKGMFWWLPAEVAGGQPMVCLRSLLEALGLSWTKWAGAVRVLARLLARNIEHCGEGGARFKAGLSPRAEPTVLLPAHLVHALLRDLSIVLAVNSPAGSTKLMVAMGGWKASWDDAQASERARALADAAGNAPRKGEEKGATPANEPQATSAAPSTPGAVLRALRGRYFLRSEDMPAMRDAARRMRRMGCSWKQIARQLGVSAATAYRLVVDERNTKICRGAPCGRPGQAQGPAPTDVVGATPCGCPRPLHTDGGEA